MFLYKFKVALVYGRWNTAQHCCLNDMYMHYVDCSSAGRGISSLFRHLLKPSKYIISVTKYFIGWNAKVELILYINFWCEVLKQGCTNPGRQIIIATVSVWWSQIFMGSQYRTCFMSPFWRLEF
jgi:hypothetical protein